MPFDYDLIAIGAGSGGISVAEKAAAYGKRTAIIEANPVAGGTCVNVGCVPKKIMWYGADVAHTLEKAADYGFQVKREGFDWGRLIKNRQRYIDGIHQWYHPYFDDMGIDLIRGHASFVDRHTLSVDGKTFTAEHIVIASGGRPQRPNIPGAELGIDSDSFFDLQQAPRRIAIIGAGYIAVELACTLRALGSEVTLLLRGQHVLARFDQTLREVLVEEMLGAGINILSCIRLASIERDDAGLSLVSEDSQRYGGFDTILWATGRQPNTADLNLQAAGITTDSQGFIPVDEYENTDVEGIYAVGDVNGKIALTPVAIAAGRRLGDRLFGGQDQRKLDYHLVPSVIFTHPPIGTVGLSEEAARKQHGASVRVYVSRFTPMYHAIGQRHQTTALKLITAGADERVVGCHIIGLGADEMLQGFAVAIRMGARKQDLDDTVAIHPTSAEELVTMK